MPCQCTVDASPSAFVTFTTTFSPRFARSVGPRKSPLKPQVGVCFPALNSFWPACMVSSKSRVPSRFTVDFASGGTASSVRNSVPTVETSASE